MRGRDWLIEAVTFVLLILLVFLTIGILQHLGVWWATGAPLG